MSPRSVKLCGVNDTDCLRQRAAQPATHDNLFHSLLGMLDVRTSIYDAGLDVAAQCRR